mmetsp:Transcript_10994/g.36410  ORF Transcript_10994/g.36410 Transcript_10994/m.36410 type:complete len:266 (+) Transcript_10994:312-1109(+)
MSRWLRRSPPRRHRSRFRPAPWSSSEASLPCTCTLWPAARLRFAARAVAPRLASGCSSVAITLERRRCSAETCRMPPPSAARPPALSSASPLSPSGVLSPRAPATPPPSAPPSAPIRVRGAGSAASQSRRSGPASVCLRCFRRSPSQPPLCTWTPRRGTRLRRTWRTGRGHRRRGASKRSSGERRPPRAWWGAAALAWCGACTTRRRASATQSRCCARRRCGRSRTAVAWWLASARCSPAAATSRPPSPAAPSPSASAPPTSTSR